MDNKKKGPSKLDYVMSNVKRAITTQSEWTDKEEFLDVIYWFRQIIGIILGVIWGVLSLKGFMGIVLFALINAVIIYCYVTFFQKVDEEEFGGIWEIVREGFPTSFSTFLVFWIVIYSTINSQLS